MKKIEKNDNTLTLINDKIDKLNSCKKQSVFTYSYVDKNGNIEEKTIVNKDKIIIGRSDNCDIVVNDTFISNKHCELIKCLDSTYLIKDLNSKNGTYVNNTRINEAQCSEGDIINLANNNIIIGESIDNINKFNETNFMYGLSYNSRRLFNEIKKLSISDAPVLITGESGTGKELTARLIYNFSSRNNNPFVAVNCGALNENFIYSELFGYERGAFTGALNDKKGAFQLANNGVLFLDEIGELPLSLQSYLLRVLETSIVKRLGSEKEEPVNVRIISATNKDLITEIKNGRFRADLYYRLAVLSVNCPPLRKRIQDIPLLVNYFMNEIKNKSERKIITTEAFEKLELYEWPGNVRELKNFVQRLCLKVEKNIITSKDVLQILNESAHSNDYYEKLDIIDSIIKNSGNISITARQLGIPRTTLRDRVKKILKNPDR